MRFAALVFGVGVTLGTAAQATCYDYEAPEATFEAPVVDICYAGTCDRSAVTVECSSAASTSIGYDTGWGIFLTPDPNGGDTVDAALYFMNAEIARYRWVNISCSEVSGEDGCRYFEFLQ